MKYFVANYESKILNDAERSQLRGSFIQLSDGITHYELTGPDGDLVVLIAGLMVPLFYWDDLVALLHERGYKTLAFSAYGRGYSDRVPLDYKRELFNRQLSDLLNALDVKSDYHLVATSMGCLVALKHVLNHASQVLSLTLSGPAGFGKQGPLLKWLLKSDFLTTLIFKYFGKKILTKHEDKGISADVDGTRLSAMLEDALQYQGTIYTIISAVQNVGLFNQKKLYEAAGKIGLPTLLFWGTDDQVTPINKLDIVVDLLKPKQIQIIDSGHMVPYENPKRMAEDLSAFIESLKESSDYE